MYYPLLVVVPSFISLAIAGQIQQFKNKPSISSAWFTGWHAADIKPAFAVADVSWDKYTHLIYSFAETTSNVQTLDLSGSEPTILPVFVKTAHQNGVKAMISVGGWTGSRFFSTDIATAANRTAFVKTIIDFVQKYNLDGVNIDWEYPNNQGIGCNTINKQDSSHLLSFLKALRKDPVGATLVVSAAVVGPFIGSNGDPMSDVSAFAEVLDHVQVMNYDVNGPWSAAVGPNAPLNDTCAPDNFQSGSAVDFVSAWSQAGFPTSKIVLGVASYGHSFVVAEKDAFTDSKKTQLALYAPFNASVAPAGDAWDDAAGVDECGNFQSQGGVINFWGLIAQGYLNPDGTPKASVPYMYDTCTQTPFVYNTTTKVMISYDDARSFAAKGAWIKSAGLAGFAIWEAGGDPNDILLDSIRTAAGF
ncbi:Glycoside hydrolase family 18 protein [Mycena indigotica]|uniref:Glycoside hydrolase family 18 protein n=1 Tax=Mycena indigotica TaxID=2126181 RepID=A0A8H6SMY5_9AGAR|nr:Glycoside hydrolase family 18 protein [Mycena indigotica]KAF7301988.1 Glycoside hydrolase family 18 protein [Mycena indigotica]